MASPQNSGSKGDSQKGAKKTSVSSQAGAGNVKGGAKTRGQANTGGARPQNSGSKGG